MARIRVEPTEEECKQHAELRRKERAAWDAGYAARLEALYAEAVSRIPELRTLYVARCGRAPSWLTSIEADLAERRYVTRVRLGWILDAIERLTRGKP